MRRLGLLMRDRPRQRRPQVVLVMRELEWPRAERLGLYLWLRKRDSTREPSGVIAKDGVFNAEGSQLFTRKLANRLQHAEPGSRPRQFALEDQALVEQRAKCVEHWFGRHRVIRVGNPVLCPIV